MHIHTVQRLLPLANALGIGTLACLALLLGDSLWSVAQSGEFAIRPFAQAQLTLAAAAMTLMAVRFAAGSPARWVRAGAVVLHGVAAALVTHALTAGGAYDQDWFRRAGLIVLAFGLAALCATRARRMSAIVRERGGTAGFIVIGVGGLAAAGVTVHLVTRSQGITVGLGLLGLSALVLAWSIVGYVGEVTELRATVASSKRRWFNAGAGLAVLLAACAGSLPGDNLAGRSGSAAITRAASSVLRGAPVGLTRAPEHATPARPRTLVLITVGSLRADHLSVYGYARRTTPQLELMAERAVLFESAYATHSDPDRTLLEVFDASLQGDQPPGLLTALTRSGYRTACLVPDTVRQSLPRLVASFDEQGAQVAGVSPASQLNALVDGNEVSPVFTWVHLDNQGLAAPTNPESYDRALQDLDRQIGELAVAAGLDSRTPTTLLLLGAGGRAFAEREGRDAATQPLYEETVRVPLLWVSGSLGGLLRISPPVSVSSVASLLTKPQLVAELTRRAANKERLDRIFERQVVARSASGGVLVAEANHRLICRAAGHCGLYDLSADPLQQRPVSDSRPEVYERLQAVAARVGERPGPEPPRYGANKPTSSTPNDAELENALESQVAGERRRAAELLFIHPRVALTDQLRWAAMRDGDTSVRRYATLALARLGENSPVTRELLASDERFWRRRAALAMAAQRSRAGSAELIAWWRDPEARSPELSRQILKALGGLRSKKSIWALSESLTSSPLRAEVAETLAAIGDKSSRWALALALERESDPRLRPRIAAALAQLGAKQGLVPALRRFLGTPTPLSNGLELASARGILKHVGGPATKRDLRRLRSSAGVGELIQVIVPPNDENQPDRGIRLLVRARNLSSAPRKVTVGRSRRHWSSIRGSGKRPPRRLPELHSGPRAQLVIPGHAGVTDGRGNGWRQRHMELPASLQIEAGRSEFLMVFAERGVEIESLAVVPLRTELEAAESSADEPRKSEDLDAQTTD